MSSRIAFFVLFASACGLFKARTDPTRFFVLTVPEHKPATPITSVVGIDRVELPEYLVREELVSRSGSSQIVVADYNRWGEPLKDGFARTLKRNLEGELGATQVVAPPFDPARAPTYLVAVEVRHFEQTSGQGAVLEAEWSVRDREKGTTVASHESKIVEAAPDKDVGADVTALSRALAKMATEIAAAIPR